MKEVTIKDKKFREIISANSISREVKRVALEISRDYNGKKPIFIAMLNGAFMFAADLMREINTPSEITFVKYSSYSGTKSTGNIIQYLGLKEDIEGRNVIIIEDLVDTGYTMDTFIKILKSKNPKSVKIVSFLFKPKALKSDIKVDYYAFDVPNDFVVGYGLDYDGYGRNYDTVYSVVD